MYGACTTLVQLRDVPWDVPWDFPWGVPWDVPWDVPRDVPCMGLPMARPMELRDVPWDVPWELRSNVATELRNYVVT